MPIRILAPEIASQIAAGEVVERPASVVKELLENALDSGADHITILIKGAGKNLIEVTDNGSGIPVDELHLAIERHATSKLSDSEDLSRIETLGFRGEALSSIGSVARMAITTRPDGVEMGAQLIVDGGKASAIRSVGAPSGTVVRVEDLFFNVPARLKFLKSDVTERRQIDRLVTQYAIAYPDVRFELTQEARQSLQTSGNGDQREVLGAMYGVDIARKMLQVIAVDGNVQVAGFISPTMVTRSNRTELLFYINGRPVKDPALSAALLKGYHTFLMVGRYPIAVVFLQMPPEDVDVNVHPAKAEVRFRDRDRVFVAVQGAVRRALRAHSPVPEFNQQLRWSPQPGGRTSDPAWSMGVDEQEGTLPGGEIGPISVPPSQTSLPTGRVPLLRLVGQVASAYLVAEGPDGLYLIDQHAAHERVLFERLMNQMQTSIPAQSLLDAVTVELPSASVRLLEEQLPVLDSLGFKIEAFGPDTFLVRAIPALLADLDPVIALRSLVEDFEEDETPLQSQIEARIIARVCKRAAVKAGQTLSAEEQRALLSDLEVCQSPRTCPHGRPTMIHLSVHLLERQFGRKGAR